jgi:hypothetical protein
MITPGRVLTLLFLLPLALQGQDAGALAEPRITWEIGEGRGSYCVHLLIAPREAADLALKGQRPVAARDYAQLLPALRRVITDEPEYAEWVPSQVCLWFTSGVTIGRRLYARADGGKKPLAIFWWGLAATGDRLGSGPGLSQIVLATNNSGLKRQMELAFIRMERLEINRDSVSESEDELFRLRLDRTDLFFSGHPRPDSTLTVGPVLHRWAVLGDANRIWQVEFGAYPTSISLLPGSLRFQGKGELAEALAASPIRFVGTMVEGGTGWMKFVE